MTQLMTIWTSTVSLLALALLLRAIEHFRAGVAAHSETHHIVEIEKEANLVYCPGDIADAEDSDDL